MRVFGVPSSGPSGAFRETDDDAGDFHLGKSVNIVDKLPTFAVAELVVVSIFVSPYWLSVLQTKCEF